MLFDIPRGNRAQIGVFGGSGLYQLLERASKYGFLFIGLTAAAFLLIELLRRLAIHPVQYALVGLALAMFFLLLTALSEHIAFAWAYAIATTACVGLITIYLVKVLRVLGLAFGAALAALYAMLYALLKAEALEFFRSGAVTPEDIARRRREGADAFAFDYVFADEGQDWKGHRL